ncbi:type I restriction modification DNA specificity domain protein [Klebsiella pneumoniae]|uniref:restriction endonuclease subunit S n=1 Tax=Klebsiella pneumoniae TaxID=573 RepID=UPI000E2AC891|nr:restriction endonuclease subunit S [Klebsiella pneumoniae]SVJ78276.1 type I restriction modification DNA specificity domain protein [Klebsiella pneumoniae]
MVPKGWSSVQYYVPEGYGVKAFRSANVREGFINDSDWVYFSHEGHAINKKSHLKTGDVLIVRTGYPGTACVVTPESEGSNAIDIVIARPDMDKIIPEYLCAYTNSHIGKSQVLDLQGGMAQKHLNVGAYQVLKINLPPLREQKKIAQILSTWDKAITVTEKLLANSQQQKKALMQQLVTGKKRLLDENGVRFSGEWKRVKLGAIADMNSGGTPKSTVEEYYGGNIPWVSISDMTSNGKWIATTEKYLTELGLNSSSARIYPKNSVLYAMYASIGECSIAAVNLTSSQAILGIRPKDCLNYEFLYFYLTSLKEKIKLEKKLACLSDEKKALMQQLLTGKRRVKVDEAVAE